MISVPKFCFRILPKPQCPVRLLPGLGIAMLLIKWYFFSHLVVVLCAHTPFVSSLEGTGVSDTCPP